MKKHYLIDMLPYADGLLKDCSSQLVFDEMQDVLHFVAHYATYTEYLNVHEQVCIRYGMKSYASKPIFSYTEND